MQVVMLVEPKMEPIPNTVQVVENWGMVNIVNDKGKFQCGGKHMLLEGTQDAIADWLREYDGVWLGKGPPQAQQFEVCHISI